MNNRGNDNFDELEPRVTPQPTILKCTTAPSVPEVSLIFGKSLDTTQHLNKTRNAREEEYETYASWKKDEFPASIDSKVDSRYANQLLDKSTNLINDSSDIKIHENSLRNQQQSQISKNKSITTPDRNSRTLTRNSSADNLRFHSYEYFPHNELSPHSFTRKKSVESPVQKRSYDGVKSILKNSSLDRTEVTNPSTNSDSHLERKIPLHIVPTPRNHVVSDYSRSSSVNRCNRQMDKNHDHGTVQDLLLLVQNQNEQIKSLQNQVEKLLQAHEESTGYRESRKNVTKKPIEIPQSPIHNESEEPSDMCLRYQNDQMRNAIMEKKVSIGVMTSFEFSVQNNPFVTDSDNQINAVLRECGKNIGDNGENWRTNICSRNIAPGVLENINEDSESYPSSIWKQGNSNNQMSSTEETISKRNLVANDKRAYNQNVHRCSPLFQDSANSFEKSSQPPIPAPRKLSTSSRKEKRIPVDSQQRIHNSDNSETSKLNNVAERESYDPHLLNDRNDCNDIFPRNLESVNRNMKSMAGENTDEVSLVLSSSDLRVNDRPPSPDPSIHVEMREYSSDDENEKTKHATPVGWTFYKNIVGQVNRILHTIPDTKDIEENEHVDATEFRNDIDGSEEIVDSVKLATLERLKMLGISYAEHSEFSGEHVQKKVTFDSSYYPRLDYQTTLPQPTSTVAESNTSMHMRALALKYLSDEQLADLAVHKQSDGSSMKHKILNSVHGTNMSLATMNYLQRYCLVSGVNTPHAEGKGHVNTIRQKKLKHMVMTKEVHAQPMPRHHVFNDSAKKKEPDNILDITTLKQQPKLL